MIRLRRFGRLTRCSVSDIRHWTDSDVMRSFTFKFKFDVSDKADKIALSGALKAIPLVLFADLLV